ncbi:hypothetical protein DEU56DRAFT_837365, partial [Suillus clintonianus]|uniref:uncharacterized protein n=1 Tax=Suillus clintonianus TaxID=1904413 RepID=UPI001B86DFD4
MHAAALMMWARVYNFFRNTASLCPEGHAGRAFCLNSLAFTLQSGFDYQHKYFDFYESIFLHEGALRPCPVGHEIRPVSLDNL